MDFSYATAALPVGRSWGGNVSIKHKNKQDNNTRTSPWEKKRYSQSVQAYLFFVVRQKDHLKHLNKYICFFSGDTTVIYSVGKCRGRCAMKSNTEKCDLFGCKFFLHSFVSGVALSSFTNTVYYVIMALWFEAQDKHSLRLYAIQKFLWSDLELPLRPFGQSQHLHIKLPLLIKADVWKTGKKTECLENWPATSSQEVKHPKSKLQNGVSVCSDGSPWWVQ